MKSNVVSMPDFSTFQIPEKQAHLHFSDDVIFKTLRNEHRKLIIQNGPAQKGDYVLAVEKTANGDQHMVHIELGIGKYPPYKQALLGCHTGETLLVESCGDPLTVTILSVKKIIELPLTDETISALQLSNIHTVVDYRRQFIKDHGEEMAEKVFSTIRRKLLDKLPEMMQVQIDEDELHRFHQEKRDMIQKISGDVDKRLMEAYADQGAKTPEECDKLLLAESRISFHIYLLGLSLAKQNGYQFSNEEKAQAIEYYKMIHEKTDEQIVVENLMDDVLQSVYIQYAVGQINAYYKSIVRIDADGVAPMAL